VGWGESASIAQNKYSYKHHSTTIVSPSISRDWILLDLNAAIRRPSPPVLYQSILHRPGYAQEARLHVDVVLGRALEEVDAEFPSQLRALLGADDLLVQHVALVPHEDLVDVYVGVLLDLGYPVSDGLEGPAVGDVVHEEDALRASEVGRGDGPETLLSGRVPDLELDALAVHLHVLDLEIDADCGNKRGGEGVIGVTQEEAGLANAGVTDHEQLALHVVGGRVGHGAIIYIIRLVVNSAPSVCIVLPVEDRDLVFDRQ
jgi:hypothetical protein